MNVFKIAVLVLIAILLALLVIERGNDAVRQRALDASLKELSAAVSQQAQELRRLREEIETIRRQPPASHALTDDPLKDFDAPPVPSPVR